MTNGATPTATPHFIEKDSFVAIGKMPKDGQITVADTGWTLESPLFGFQAMVKERYADVHMNQSQPDVTTALYIICAGYAMDKVDQELMRNDQLTLTCYHTYVMA